ncbi:MAG: FkbM family methyltransferase [Candidatus Promineifilaceae bacterium]
MPKFLQRFLPKRKSDQPFKKATAEDLYYCYRLLLQREPDEGSWNVWHKLITNQTVTIQMLVDLFLYSDEFKKLQEEAFKLQLIKLENFNIYIRKNDFFIGAVIANTQNYEPYVTNEVQRLLQPGMVFIDVGANIGYFTLLAAALVGPTGKVYAFEPNPDNCRMIEMSIEANGFENIQLFPYAVAEARQSFNLDVGGANSNGRIIDFSPEAVPGQGTPMLIEAVTLDETLADLERVDLIKLDIEGAEPRAWQGMQQIIGRFRPILVFEFSPELIRVTSHSLADSFLDEIIGSQYDLFILERFKDKSERPQSAQQILHAHAHSGLSHLDLVAIPRKS